MPEYQYQNPNPDKHCRRRGDYLHEGSPCRLCGNVVGTCHHPTDWYVKHDREVEAEWRVLGRFDIAANKDGFELIEDDVSHTTFKDPRFDRHHRLMDLWMFIGYKLGLIEEDPRWTHTRWKEARTWMRDIHTPNPKGDRDAKDDVD